MLSKELTSMGNRFIYQAFSLNLVCFHSPLDKPKKPSKTYVNIFYEFIAMKGAGPIPVPVQRHQLGLNVKSSD